MQEDDSITVMRLAREYTDSLHVLEDARSHTDQTSLLSENTAKLSLRFDFDQHILGSRVYQAATKSNVRSLINTKLIDQIQRGDDHHALPQIGRASKRPESQSSSQTLQLQ